jgi:hypothetical protein
MRTFVEKLSEKQISKIQSELDFFKSKGFEITEERNLPRWRGGEGMKYVLHNNNGIELTCIYDLLYSERLSCRFSMWSEKWGFYVRDGIKTFKEFRKDFE